MRSSAAAGAGQCLWGGPLPSQQGGWGEQYAAHADGAGLNRAAFEDIVAAGGSQFLRAVLPTDSLRRTGLRGAGQVDRTLAVVLARGDDRSAQKVVSTIAGQAPSTPVALWSHEAFSDACSAQPELAEWRTRMQRRYLLASDGAHSPLRSTAGLGGERHP
jgi:hypothetical protein